jgi:predicted ATPase
MSDFFHIPSLKIKGYRPFGDFTARFSALEVIVGANGSGKSSLFEFLKFLRDSVHQDIPPEIIPGSIGQQIFHKPGPDKFWWSVEVDTNRPTTLYYQGEVWGPVGRIHIAFERVETRRPLSPRQRKPYLFLDLHEQRGVIQDPESGGLKQQLQLRRPTQLALSTATNPAMVTLYNLREYISGWRFYSSFNIANDKIRKSVPTSQEPLLHEDAGNLSAVLFYLMTEHREAFDALQTHLRTAIPGFKGLTVKARGGPGEVIAFWREQGVDEELGNVP